jgi:hypothetical protein
MRWLGACALLLMAASSIARADEGAVLDRLTAEQKAEYEELTKKGIREYELNHWAEAKTYFLRAHTLFPNARTLRALGLIAFETRSYIEAVAWLERALADAHKPLTDEMRKGVADLLADARGFVGRVRLVLEPANASVFLDGELVQLRDQNVLLLDPGEHELRIEAGGYRTQSHRLRVEGGKSSELKLALVAADSSPATPADVEVAAIPPASEAPPAVEWWSTQRIVGVGLGVGAVAAFGVGLTAGLLALSAKSDSDHNCDGDVCNATGSAQRDAAVTRADIASIGFIAGGALLAAGAITFFLAPAPEHSRGELSVRPGFGGVVIEGRL